MANPAPPAPPAPPPQLPMAGGQPRPQKAGKPIWKRWWAISLAVLVVLIVIGAAMGGSKDKTNVTAKLDSTAPAITSTEPATTPTTADYPSCDSFATQQEADAYVAAHPTPNLDVNGDGKACEGFFPKDTVPATAAPTTTVAPTTVAPTTVAPTAPPLTTAPPPPPPTTAPPPPSGPSAGETVSQGNARKTAADYLDYSSFSRSGLIDQLVYEKFSREDAAYGTDAQNADWNEQAAKTAADYLSSSSFSRGGLIEQLVYDGFTQAQAQYGVSTTGL